MYKQKRIVLAVMVMCVGLSSLYPARSEVMEKYRVRKGLKTAGRHSPDTTTAQGRVVHFPPSRSIGILYIQDEGIANIHHAFSNWSGSPKDQWQLLGPAKGDVVVPPGKRLSLTIPQEPKDGWKDLSPLKNLKPDDLYQLWICGQISAATNPGDICMPHITHLTGLKDLSLNWTDVSTNGLQYIKDFHSLEYLRLPGEIDDSAMILISRLKSLKGLYLSGTGRVTDEGLACLKALPNLEELSFDGPKKITSASLRYLSKISSLKRLSFCFNSKVTSRDLIHLGDMPSLKSLRLDHSNITNSGLRFFSNLKHLEELSLHNTNVTDAGVPHLLALKSLRRLNLQKQPGSKKTPITEKAAPYLARIQTLEYLNLECLSVTDYALSELSTLPNLRALYASYGSTGKSLTDQGLDHLSKTKSLELLYIRTEAVTDKGMLAIAQLPNLKTLDISFGPNITKQGLAHLTALKQLTSFSISPHGHEIGISISDLACLNKMTNLKTMSLAGIIQDGSGLDISGLKNIESLDITSKRIWDKRNGKWHISHKSFTDKDLACLENLTHLKSLSLWSTGAVTDKGLSCLQNLTNLERLIFSEASLTDQGLIYLKDMQRLNDLSIGGNFTEKGIQHLKELKALECLRLFPKRGVPNRAVRELKKNLPFLSFFELKMR